MSRFAKFVLALMAIIAVVAALSVIGVLAQTGKKAQSGVEVENLDKNVAACDDFNQFANGGWLAKNSLPGEYSSWGLPQILRERTLEQLHTILDTASKSRAPKGSNEKKIGDYYFSGMDTATRDKVGIKALDPWMKRINDVNDTKSLQAAFAYLATYNVDSPFGVGSVPDFKNSSRILGGVNQSGISLPDRDYYLKDDDKSKGIREQYLKHISRTFALMGEDPDRSDSDAKTVLEIETRLANASLARVEMRNPFATYNLMDQAQRKELTPNFDWDAYFVNVGLNPSSTINVGQPKFFKEVDAMVTAVPIENWKTYLRWRLVNFTSPFLSSDFEKESFEFYSRTLAGTKEQPALWKRVTSATSSRLGEAVGQVYVKQYFPADAKSRMKELVANLRAALREDIEKLDWMGDATRSEALKKLDALSEKIGYPDKWIDYSALEVDRGPFAANMLKSQHWSLVRDLAKADKPADRSEWETAPQTINAGYLPFNNEIIFPAGILQAPIFDPKADDAANYGAIGAIIGHEMTHGFDDQGAQFDAQGNLRRWWTPEDYGKFQARTHCVETQFDAFTLADGTHIKGKVVKGEAVADLGGLKIAWLAYQKALAGKPKPPTIDGLTPEQRFFLGFGQAWRAIYTPQAELLQTNTDVHPLSRFRLNGTVSNMPEFFAAFGCESGKMFRGNDRCQIW